MPPKDRKNSAENNNSGVESLAIQVSGQRQPEIWPRLDLYPLRLMSVFLLTQGQPYAIIHRASAWAVCHSNIHPALQALNPVSDGAEPHRAARQIHAKWPEFVDSRAPLSR
jgi:hypothetical protein